MKIKIIRVFQDLERFFFTTIWSFLIILTIKMYNLWYSFHSLLKTFFLQITLYVFSWIFIILLQKNGQFHMGVHLASKYSTCTCRVYMDVLYKQAQMWRYVITYKQLEKVFNWFASNLIGIWRMYEHFNWEYVVNQGVFFRVYPFWLCSQDYQSREKFVMFLDASSRLDFLKN